MSITAIITAPLLGMHNKINAIKELRRVINSSLTEAKDVIMGVGLPYVIENMSRVDFARLRAVGLEMEILDQNVEEGESVFNDLFNEESVFNDLFNKAMLHVAAQRFDDAARIFFILDDLQKIYGHLSINHYRGPTA